MPESAYGPTNNCVGIANVLRQELTSGKRPRQSNLHARDFS